MSWPCGCHDTPSYLHYWLPYLCIHFLLAWYPPIYPSYLLFFHFTVPRASHNYWHVLQGFSLLPFTSFGSIATSNCCNWTTPPEVMELMRYGPNQCICNLPGCLEKLLSYIRTKSLCWNVLFLICQSCQDFCRIFSTHWWKPKTKWYSSSCINYAMCSSSVASSSMPIMVAMRRLGTMYSIGMTASFPYNNLNGIFPINLLQVVRYAQNNVGIFKSQ